MLQTMKQQMPGLWVCREGIQISKPPTISLKWIYPWKLCRNLLLDMDPSEQRVFIYNI